MTRNHIQKMPEASIFKNKQRKLVFTMNILMQWWHDIHKFPWNHHFRRYYRHGDTIDPQIGLWAGGLGMLFMLFCTLMLGKYDLEDSQETIMEIICACTLMMSPILIILFSILLYSGPIKYLSWLRELSSFLNCPLLNSTNISTYQQIAHRHLTDLATDVIHLERDNKPYFRECVVAKARFEAAYRFCLETGLIQDVGYKPFFVHG